MQRGKALRSRARNIVNSVYEYFQEERMKQQPVIDINKVVERTGIATNVSVSTIKRIRAEHRKIVVGGHFTSPKKNQTSQRIIFDFDKALLRRIIHNYYTEKKEVPTVHKLLKEMQSATGFEGKEEYLRRQLKKNRICI